MRRAEEGLRARGYGGRLLNPCGSVCNDAPTRRSVCAEVFQSEGLQGLLARSTAIRPAATIPASS